jgi:hypothetical protein
MKSVIERDTSREIKTRHLIPSFNLNQKFLFLHSIKRYLEKVINPFLNKAISK